MIPALLASCCPGALFPGWAAVFCPQISVVAHTQAFVLCRYGVIFEFYDAQDTHDPRTLLRKGASTGGVRDYHWSAALTLKMILWLHQ